MNFRVIFCVSSQESQPYIFSCQSYLDSEFKLGIVMQWAQFTKKRNKIRQFVKPLKIFLESPIIDVWQDIKNASAEECNYLVKIFRNSI